MSFFALLVAYILGGLTFVPLLVVAAIAVVLRLSPEVGDQRAQGSVAKLDEATANLAKKERASTRIYRSGWLTVRRTFEAANSIPPIPLPPTSTAGSGVGSGASKASAVDDNASLHSASSGASLDSGYMTSLASSYRNFMDSRSKDPKRSRPKDRFYAVLKDSVLFLYETEQETDCYAAIKVTLHDVVIYPEGLIDGELFMKKNAILLRPHISAAANPTEVPSLVMGRPQGSVNGSPGADPLDTGHHQPWYLFPSINHDKEDWYHSLVSSSKCSDPGELATDASLFDSDDMSRLVQAIDEQPDPIPTRWLNAMIGRLFFSVYRTSAVEDYIVRKLVRKLNKINKPSFLSDIEVMEVNVGATTPFFSKPMLKELTAEGDASMEMKVKYDGDFRITIGTTATLNLGTRFKSYSVRLVLAVVLKELEGTLLFKIKRPPSNRVWFAFTSMPRLVLSIEPVVSTRQIKWSMITKPIESRLREVVLESIVLPHMDDIAFMNTRRHAHRGGIFGDSRRKEPDLTGTNPPGARPHDSAPEDSELEEEGGTLAPGVPNLKLGDDKADEVGLRQRAPLSRKKSDSNMSTKSAPPIPANSDKEKEHSRKKSWFSTYTSAIPSAISPTPPSNPTFDCTPTSISSLAFASDSALPAQGRPDLPTQAAVSRTPSTKRQAPPPAPDSYAAHEDGAADKLRGILQSDRTTASRKASISGQSTSEGTPGSLKMAADTLSAGSNAGIAASSLAPPSSSSASSASLDSISTTKMPTKDQPFDIGSAYTADAVARPTISRKKSDKSISSIQTTSSTNSIGGPPITISIDPTSSAASSSSNLGQSPTNTTSALLNQWKAKAADKQAIQASVDRGVLQAKDAMNKWSNRWQAYKKQQAERTQGSELGQDEVPSRQYHYHAPEPAPDVFAASTTPPHRSSSPLANHTDLPSSSPASSQKPRTSGDNDTRNISASPTGHFIKPSTATAATSLAVGEAVAMVPSTSSTGQSLPSDSQSAKPLKRVPPPSTIPVHPAFSTADKHARRSSTQTKPGYQAAPMMAIPGIEDSRRFALGSADLAADQAAPALPSRPLPPIAPVASAEEILSDSTSHVSAVQHPATAPSLPARSTHSQAPSSDSSLSQVRGQHEEASAPEAPPLPSRPVAPNVTIEMDEGKAMVPAVAVEPPTPLTTSVSRET